MVLNEVKPIENINQNPQTFQGTSRIQKEVPYSWKMQHRKCEWQNRFELKKDNAHRKNALVNRAFQICLTYSKNIWSNWFKRLNAHLISLSYPIYLFVHILWPSLRTHLPLQMTFRDRQKYSLHWKCTTRKCLMRDMALKLSSYFCLVMEKHLVCHLQVWFPKYQKVIVYQNGLYTIQWKQIW